METDPAGAPPRADICRGGQEGQEPPDRMLPAFRLAHIISHLAPPAEGERGRMYSGTPRLVYLYPTSYLPTQRTLWCGGVGRGGVGVPDKAVGRKLSVCAIDRGSIAQPDAPRGC